jgi:hypothetical protein
VLAGTQAGRAGEDGAAGVVDVLVERVRGQGPLEPDELDRVTVPRRPAVMVGTPATYGFATRNGRKLADNAPEAMLSLVLDTAVPSGLTPAVTRNQRAASFPYVVPA